MPSATRDRLIVPVPASVRTNGALTFARSAPAPAKHLSGTASVFHWPCGSAASCGSGSVVTRSPVLAERAEE